MILILGAGLSGLSCSYHLGHDKCLILEKSHHAFGHIHSEFRNGYTWDQGPHVSFTKHEYVRQLFSESTDTDFDEREVTTANYFNGNWIDHPAQSNLYQVPNPLRDQCLTSFLESRQDPNLGDAPKNYQQWLEKAFGKVFADTFPAAYTRKYWTVEPAQMTTDWVGGRVFQPNTEDVMQGSVRRLDRQTHYIQKIRYPKKGGYEAFAKKLRAGARIRFGAEICRIDLRNRQLWTSDGQRFEWTKLINTLPLPQFVSLCENPPPNVLDAARELSCSSVLLVNVAADHETIRKENWMYVYDETKYSTRINCTEMLTPGNTPPGCSGIQVEVYSSRHRPLAQDTSDVSKLVVSELKEMGLLRDNAKFETHTKWCPWANVIFTHETRPALDLIWSWLETLGLQRETDDLIPLTDWDKVETSDLGRLAMAGRFAQWKYFWTDDCVLRGKHMNMIACM
jgi:protoporphyrinogen oxidase